jgi:hypothetical protein
MKRLLVAPRPPLDQRWFARLQPLAAIPSEIYTYMKPPQHELDAARERFYARAERIDIPLLPDEIHRPIILHHLEELDKLKLDVIAGERNDIIRELYVSRIDELITNCRMWLAAAAEDMDTFEQLNRFIYGGPDPAIHAASCAYLREHAARYLTHESIGVREAAEATLRVLPDLEGDSSLIIPDEPTFRAVADLHTTPGGYMDMLFAGVVVPSGLPVGPREGDLILRQVLKNVRMRYTISNSGDVFWGVRHATREVMRPAEYRLPPETFRAIIAHEVGSHLLEASNGLRGPLRLLSIGLDRYELGNEGRAYLREQLATNSVSAALQDIGWYFSLAKHLAICLASGLDGRRRTFSEVYAVVSTIYTLWERLQRPDQQILADEAAHREAWYITVRVLKGTDGKGGAHLKDMVYLEGNVNCWNTARQDPYSVLQGDLGKFDISNSKHVTRLRTLGILP